MRGTVHRVVDVLCIFPLCALIVHPLHDCERERFGIGVGMGFSGHELAALVQTGISEADGGIPTEEQFVDFLAFFKTGQCAILPEDGCGVGEGSEKTLVTKLECPVAKFQPLVKNLPEFVLVSPTGERHIYEVDGDNTLVDILTCVSTRTDYLLDLPTVTMRKSPRPSNL